MAVRVLYRGRVASANPNAIGGHHFMVTSLVGLSDRGAISDWCEANFGPSWSWWTSDVPGRWHKSNASWIIHSDDDAMVFRLRWC